MSDKKIYPGLAKTGSRLKEKAKKEETWKIAHKKYSLIGPS